MKTIVILSPDCWGVMKVSKMHFAEELVKRGYRVYFVNPPRRLDSEKDCFEEPVRDGIVLIHVKEHPLRIILREKFFFLYGILERRYIRAIKRIAGQVDQVWNFNPLFIINGDRFGAGKNVLFVYDLFRVRAVGLAAERADAVFSVAEKILDTLQNVGKPKFLLRHGLADAFEAETRENRMSVLQGSEIKIGYTGNLFHPGIARDAFMKIVSDHPGIGFHIWGAVGFSDNNLSTDEAGEEIQSFIAFMKARKNVFFHGIKAPEILAKEMQGMNGFLALYSPGSNLNAHKILEYLSTGKAVFATAIEQYKGTDLLIQNDKGTTDFPVFFAEEIKRLERHNSIERQRRRIAFALDNTYAKQVDRIFTFSALTDSSRASHQSD